MPKTPNPNLLKNMTTQAESAEISAEISAVLGIDYGEKYSGLAWINQGVVFPLVIVTTDQLLGQVQKISAEKSIHQIILGLPLGGRGEENDICAQVRIFGHQLQKQGYAVAYINERFSTQNTTAPTPDRRDDLAAAQILEFWLRGRR